MSDRRLDVFAVAEPVPQRLEVPVNAVPAIPEVPLGTVLELQREDWRYGGHHLRLRVDQIRHDLSHYYDNQWVWLVGERLDRDGTPLGQMGALVRVSVLAAKV